MSEKKYLDLSGLESVAGKVNSRLKTVTEMPETADDGAVRLYVGTTDENYTLGHTYKYDSENELWLDITPTGSASGWDTVTTMPAATVEGQVVLYKGSSTVDYAYGGFYQCVNGEWVFLGALIQLVEVPFNLTLTSITPIAEGDTTRTLTFTASTESVVTEESFSGVLANGVIQGKFWNDIGGSISQVNETTFQVTLDTDVTDSLGQLAQFPEGSSITIPSFSWIDGITQYIHNSETISISEEVVTQTLAFNTTGTLDSSTGTTTFVISSAYEVPFVLSYENISTVTMIDSNYENEVTQSWTPSIVAANDTTTLVFTPNDSTALHGDNIAITVGTLTAVSNGITYTYDFSTDNINLRWGNTTWSFGVYNNFASFTAAPTSANTGSATLTLNPTGPGATERELAFMSNLLPTVTIYDNEETKEFTNVSWTEGAMVASDASEVTSVANKLITVTWNEDTTSDFDAYGVECFVSVNSLSLSATCAYIEHDITLSDPVLNYTSGETNVQVQLTASEELPDTLYVDYTEVTLRTRAVLQGRLVTSDSTSNASASGTSFYINDIPDLVDSLNQRAVYSTGSNVVIGAFEYIDGDDKYIHASQTITVTETLTTQKLAFNTTGTVDSSTGVTTFVINASNVVPFVLSTTDTFTTTMLSEGYGSETTVTWVPTVNYGDSDTELIFTPDNATALHGDNITFSDKVLNFVSNGVTYEIDTSEDTLNIRWANTSYDFGTFNNFASFTAVPTSANSGSITCTLSPTGPGDDDFELEIMALNLPTVTIDSVECGTVVWTQGQIVASDASGITVVGGKTVDIVWNDNAYSDTDSYGITRTATFVAKALSVTCGYITFNLVLSDPVPALTDDALSLSFTTDETISEDVSIPESAYSASATGILQMEEKTVTNNDAVFSGSSFTISSFDDGVDLLGQRMVFPSGSVTVGDFDYVSNDYRVTHDSQTLSIAEESISVQGISIQEVATITPGNYSYIFTFPSYVTLSSSTTSLSAATTTIGVTKTGESKVVDWTEAFTYTGTHVLTLTDFYGAIDGVYTRTGFEFGSDITVQVTVTSTPTISYLDVDWQFINQTFTMEPFNTSSTIDFANISSVAVNYDENDHSGPTLTFNTPGKVGSGALAALFSALNGTITITNGYGDTVLSGLSSATLPLEASYVSDNTTNISMEFADSTNCRQSGTFTMTIPALETTVEISDSDGYQVSLYNSSSQTFTGTYTYSEFFDDDDCDDD